MVYVLLVVLLLTVAAVGSAAVSLVSLLTTTAFSPIIVAVTSCSSTGSSAAAGQESPPGAVLQSAAERDGANWRSAYLNVNRSPQHSSEQFSLGRALPPSSAAASHSALSPGLGVAPAAGPAASTGPAGSMRRPVAHTPRARISRKKYTPRVMHAAAAASEPQAAAAAASAGSASNPFSAAAAAAAGAAARGASFGLHHLGCAAGAMPRERPSNGGGERGGGGGEGGRSAATGAVGSTAGSRFEEGDSDLEPLDIISRHDELGTRSEWDDVLAAVSLPHQTGDDSLRRAESPDGGQQ